MVKCVLVQALRLCTGCTAHRGSRGIALHFHGHGTRRGWGVSVTPWLLFTPGKDPVPTVQEAGWAPRPVWTGAENLAPTGIWSPDHPARSQLVYRLSYRAHFCVLKCGKNNGLICVNLLLMCIFFEDGMMDRFMKWKFPLCSLFCRGWLGTYLSK